MQTTNNKQQLDFNDVYNRYYNEVKFFIFSKIKSMDISEEIANDTFLKVYNKLNTYNSELSKINTWIYNIAKNSLIDYVRHENSTNKNINISNFVDAEGNEFFSFISDNKTDASLENNELKNSIDLAFQKITNENQRKIGLLFFIEDMSYDDISKMLNVPLGTVKVMILRCRNSLQKNLMKTKIEYSIH